VSLPPVDIAKGGCWLTRYVPSANGYVTIRGRGLAHRLFFEERNGPIGEGFDLDHLCRNRACVNPEHLEPVDRRENLDRSSNPTIASSGAPNRTASTAARGGRGTSPPRYFPIDRYSLSLVFPDSAASRALNRRRLIPERSSAARNRSL